MRPALRTALAAAALALGCAPRVVPRPIAARDGQTLAREAPIRVALVGGFAAATDPLVADLRAANLDLLVLAGDSVARGAVRHYLALRDRLGDLPVLPIPGDGEARGDRRLRRWRAAWSGLGTAETDRPVSWRAIDLVSDGHPWRVVALDADRDRLGPRFVDQTFWLPRACRTESPLIVLTNRPVGSLGADWDAARSGGAATLHDLVRRHVPASRLALVAASGTRGPELLLPGGPWGEGWLGVGHAAGPPGTVRRAVDGNALEPALDAAWSERFGPRPSDAGYDVTGWWLFELDGAALRLALRMPDAQTGAWDEAYAIGWTADGGWAPP